MAQQRSEETKRKIQIAAEALFCESGYEATSVDAICRMAQVTKGAFYHHYPSKQALFLNLIYYWLETLDMGFQVAIQNATSVPDAFQQMAEQMDLIYNHGPNRLPLLLEFYNQATRDPVIWEATVEPYHKYVSNFATMVRKGIAEGSLAPIDPDLAARIIVSLGAGLVMQGLMDPHHTNWGEVAREGVAHLLAGLQYPRIDE